MRVAHCLVFLLVVGSVNGFGLGSMISGLVEGLTEGGIKGTVGSFAPLIQSGMKLMYNLFQAQIQSGMGMINSLIQAAPQLMGNITNMFSGIFQQGTKAIGAFTGMGRLSMEQIKVSTQHGIGGTLAVLTQLKAPQQKAIAGTLGNVNQVMLAMTKLRMDTLKSAHNEVPAIHKVLESEHKSNKILFAALKEKAPKLSGFAQGVYEKMVTEFNASKKKMDKPAQQGLTMMQDSIRLSQKGIEKTLGTMSAGAKKEFGSMFHVMNNMIHLTNAAF